MKKISQTIKNKSRLTKEEWKEYTKTVWSIANVSDREHPAVFPPEIPHRLIKMFSFVGERVLDPFAGVGTTGAVALKLGRKAVCVDQNGDYVRIIKKRCNALPEAKRGAALEVVKADSRNLKFIENESISLIVTSPPYWDKANYGTGKANLGQMQSYRDFLHDMRDAFQECFRVLEPGRKMCVVIANVNQQTDHGLLTFPISSDFGNILREIGFVMINEIIWSKDKTGGRWGSANMQRPIFGSYPFPPNFLFKNVHEYVLVFSKPAKQKRTGSKVRQYAGLMGDMVAKPLKLAAE